MSEPLPPFSPDEVARILSFVPPAPDNELWVKLCASVCSEIGEDDGLRVLLAWSPDYGDKSTATVIRSFKGVYKSTIATLIDEAKKHGFDASAYARERAAKLRAVPASPRNEKSDTQPPKKSPAPVRRNENTDTPPARTRARGNASAAVKLAPVQLGKCSICDNWNAPQTVKETELRECLEAVKAGKWRDEVEAVRAGTREKSTLPQVNAYGVYRERRLDDNLQTRSGFLVLDYDGKDNPTTDFFKLRSRLAQLPFVLAVFASPSGNGLKALIRVPDDVNDSAAFAAVQKILAPLGGVLDAQSGARKHFVVSADENAYVNPAPLDEIPPLPAAFDDCAPSVLGVLFADTVEQFYFAEKDDYFFHQRGVFKKLSKSDATEEFSVRYGVSRAAARKALYAVREQRHVSVVFKALTCRRAGMHILDDEKVLVLQSTKVIEADEGQFPTIRKLIESVFPRGHFNQAWRFLHWLQCARRAYLRCVESGGEIVSPIPLLMLLGTRGAGKSLLFSLLINPALGNRRAGRMDTFIGEKTWFGKCIGCECVLGTELPNLTAAQRDLFKAAIKKFISGEGYDAEKKGEDGFTFIGQHFLVLLANIDDGGNCAASCPAIDEDFKDKFLALSLMNPDAVKAAFPTKDKKKNIDAIRRELPAFLYWLEYRFEAPPDWQDERFGVKGYTAPAAAKALNEVAPSASVDEKVSYLVEKFPAEMLEKKLTTAEVAKKIGDVFNERTPNPIFLGKELRKLCKIYPKRYRFNGSDSSPKYEFFRLTDDDEAAEAVPVADSDTDAALANVSPFEGLDF